MRAECFHQPVRPADREVKMKKIDPAVKKETLRIAVGTVLLSGVMELVFVLLGKWDLTVLFGNLVGAFAAVLNFFLMGLTVVKCVSLPPDKAAAKIRVSQGARLLMLAAICGLAALFPKVFNLIAAVVPLLFPRLVIMAWQLLGKKDKSPVYAAESDGETAEETTTEDTEN